MRIILADHHAEPHFVLKTLIEVEQEFDLVGEAIDAQGLLSLAEKQTPDLILMDRDLSGNHIEHLIVTLHALKPRPVIIVMSSEIGCSRLVLRAGADAFVSKVDDPAWLVEKLQGYAKIVTEKAKDLSEEQLDAAMNDLGIEGQVSSDQEIAMLEAEDDQNPSV